MVKVVYVTSKNHKAAVMWYKKFNTCDSVLFTATFSLGNMLGSAFYPDIEITYMTSILYQARRLKPIRLVYFLVYSRDDVIFFDANCLVKCF
jgi:hypothetical protein